MLGIWNLLDVQVENSAVRSVASVERLGVTKAMRVYEIVERQHRKERGPRTEAWAPSTLRLGTRGGTS